MKQATSEFKSQALLLQLLCLITLQLMHRVCDKNISSIRVRN